VSIECFDVRKNVVATVDNYLLLVVHALQQQLSQNFLVPIALILLRRAVVSSLLRLV
jgi:hypothetical protein